MAAMSDLLTRNVLVINQKAKLVELTDEYRIRDEEGNDIGFIREEGQSVVKKAVRLVSDLDQFFTHRLAVYDRDGTKVVELVRPAEDHEVARRDHRRPGTPGRDDRPEERARQEALRPGGNGAASASGRSTPRTGGPGTSRSRTRPAPRWAGSRRSGPACSGRASRRRTTTCSRSPPRSRGDLRLMMLGSAAGVDLALKQDSG